MSSRNPQYSPQIALGGRITPGVKALLIANIGVWVLQELAHRVARSEDIELIFSLVPNLVLHKFQLWRLVSYMFLHSWDWPGHIIVNMLMFWMFGTEVERVWGTREFVKYYFLCGIGAGLTTCLTFRDSKTIGASGAVFGVMLAYGLMYANRQGLFYFIFPMRAINFVLLCTGIELYSLLNVQDGVAHFAHLGGMLSGYLYLKRAWRLKEFWNELRWRLRRRRFRVMRGEDRHYPYH